jgi:peptidoglycan biosynthesis protein MviN/MurJ (putative lipid II flippase)
MAVMIVRTEREKVFVVFYEIGSVATIVYSLLTTLLSIPNYEDDAVERNLKHALLNISADMATLVGAIGSMGILWYQWRKSKKEEWVVCTVSLAVGLLGLLSSIGSEDSMKEGLLGGIKQWWVGLICWIVGTLCFSYLEVRGVMQRRKIRREREQEGRGVELAVLTRGG